MSTFGPALLIARRDAGRHKGRSLLIMALVALPVAAIVALAVLYRSAIGTAGNDVDAQLGRAELGAAAAMVAAPVGATTAHQGDLRLNGNYSFDHSDGSQSDGSQEALRPAEELLALLPQGAVATPFSIIGSPIRKAGGSYLGIEVESVDLGSVAAGGRFAVESGRVPTAEREVGLSAEVAQRVGARVGDTVEMGSPSSAFTVVGVLDCLVPRLNGAPCLRAVTLPGQLESTTFAIGTGLPLYLVAGVAFTAEDIAGLNAVGMAVYARSTAAGPGVEPLSDVPVQVAIGAVVIGTTLAVLQVVFLAGPAFAVGARRMRSQLAQLGTVGGSAAQIRSVVLASGVVLGVGGSVVGAAVGVAVPLIGGTDLTNLIGVPFREARVLWSDLIFAVLLGTGTALLAALAPAVSAGRRNLVAALGQAPGGRRAVRWWSTMGAVLFLAGVAMMVAAGLVPADEAERATGGSTRSYVVAGGVVLAQIGLLLATPLLLVLAARAGRLLPGTSRMALRDMARHRGRSAPAVGAVLAVTSVAVAVASYVASMQASVYADYQPGLPTGTGVVRTLAESVEDPPTLPVEGDLAAAPGARFGQLVPPPDGDGIRPDLTWNTPPENECPYSAMPVDGMGGVAFADGSEPPGPPTAAELPAAAVDWRCAGADYSTLDPREAGVRPVGQWWTGQQLPDILVGGSELRQLVTGVADPEGDRVLDNGGVLVLDRRALSATGTLNLSQISWDDEGNLTAEQAHRLPAVRGIFTDHPVTAIVSPAAAATAQLDVFWRGLVLAPGPAVSTESLNQVDLGLQADGISAESWISTAGYPYDDLPSAWLLIAVAAVLISLVIAVVTALAVSDARSDLITLAGVGAKPWMRRRFSGWSALVVATLGIVLGGLLGLLPAWALVRMQAVFRVWPDDVFEVPWLPILALLATIPPIAFLVAAGVTRSRIPLVGRQD